MVAGSFKIPRCPNPGCPSSGTATGDISSTRAPSTTGYAAPTQVKHANHANQCESLATVVRNGKFWRADDSRWVQRYRCKTCKKRFSAATGKDTWRQARRRYNSEIVSRLVQKGSQRGIARALGIDRSTVASRTKMYGIRAANYFAKLNVRNLRHAQFDEMQSSIHTKCKPVSMPVAVCAKTRMILYLDVCEMPAQHPLKEISEAKYGPRSDERPAAVAKAMEALRPMLAKGAQITTDRALRYVEPIRAILPDVAHLAFKSRKARIGGQGELKKIGLDPLFPINHTAAMFRDGVARLIRKTWCNSKRLDMLRWHMLLYAHYFNTKLLKELPAGA